MCRRVLRTIEFHAAAENKCWWTWISSRRLPSEPPLSIFGCPRWGDDWQWDKPFPYDLEALLARIRSSSYQLKWQILNFNLNYETLINTFIEVADVTWNVETSLFTRRAPRIGDVQESASHHWISRGCGKKVLMNMNFKPQIALRTAFVNFWVPSLRRRLTAGQAISLWSRSLSS